MTQFFARVRIAAWTLLMLAGISQVSEVVADDSDARHVKVTVIFRGAADDADLPVLMKALRETKGIQVHTEDVGFGFRRFNNKFSTPVEVSIPKVPGDEDANVGMLAKAVSGAKTPSRGKYPPGVNLILFTDDQLNEGSISSLRSSLSRVNGLEVDKPGGLGAAIQEGWCWVRLENAGGAMLLEIEKNARNSGIQFRRLADNQ